ncbi:MAG: EutN/CcmL family microcompartment protein [Ilumatobacter sp.]|uniref:EutN/CcmL family microcompartment protein n=1 Tax=Ilumatobacter sp. TaxID=1967498 RepID=UPI002633B360|nr:EutN/CcmL family microcompartment protein [Ilumatobacter sp.]MDJ0771243.1 EutN/CcmL family microcompartment protein [Ilumatobacter sp.]
MKVAEVAGTVVSPISHPFFDGKRLLLCDLIDPDGTVGGYVIAVDVVNAGVGERVLILDEGSSARQIFDVATGPIRAVVVGIVDEIA